MISDLGGRFMSDPAGFARADEMNVAPGVGVYMAGRFGVLGRVHADVVMASAVFIEPGLLSREWNKAMETADPAQAAEIYASIAANFGQDHFANVPDLGRWVEFAERVVDNASLLGAPLFAGWRAMPRSDDVAARAGQLAHVLRELRFSLHANTVVAAGIDPLVLMTCTPDAESRLPLFGWPKPYPVPTDADRAGRRKVEEATNDLSTRTLEALTVTEAEEFVSLTEGIIAAV